MGTDPNNVIESSYHSQKNNNSSFSRDGTSRDGTSPDGASRDGNFQTENMIQKIKKVKRKKITSNFKNIEPLENIHDVEPDPSSPKIIEGLSKDGIARFKESDWEGGDDNIYEGGDANSKPVDIRQKLIDIINKVYDSIDGVSYYIAYHIALPLSGDAVIPTDVKLLKKYVGWGFSILFSTWAIYNWYFLMFYKDKTMNTRIDLIDFSRYKLSYLSFTNPFLKLLRLFIRHSLFFPEKLELYFVKKMPTFIEKWFNSTMSFTMLFFVIIMLVYRSGMAMRTFCIDALMVNTKNYYINLMYATVILLFLVALPGDEFSLDPTALLAKLNPFYFMYWLLKFVFKLLVVMFLGVPLGGIFCILYFFIYSLFGVFIYSNFSVKTMYDNFINIENFASSSRNAIRVESACRPNTFFETIMNIVNSIFDFIYKYSFYVAFIYMLLYAVFDYIFHMKNTSLLNSLFFINLIIIIIVGLGCMIKYKSKTADEGVAGEPTIAKAKVLVKPSMRKADGSLPEFEPIVVPATAAATAVTDTDADMNLDAGVDSLKKMFGLKNMPDALNVSGAATDLFAQASNAATNVTENVSKAATNVTENVSKDLLKATAPATSSATVTAPTTATAPAPL